MATNISVAKECDICSQCHHPLEVTSCSAPSTSTPMECCDHNNTFTLSSTPVPSSPTLSALSSSGSTCRRHLFFQRSSSHSAQDDMDCHIHGLDQCSCSTVCEDLESSEEFDVHFDLTSSARQTPNNLSVNCSLREQSDDSSSDDDPLVSQAGSECDSGTHSSSPRFSPSDSTSDFTVSSLESSADSAFNNESDWQQTSQSSDFTNITFCDDMSSFSLDCHFETSNIEDYLIVSFPSADVPDSGVDSPQGDLPFCAKHSHDIAVLLCIACEQPICVRCTTQGHKDHQTSSILPMITGHRDCEALTRHLNSLQCCLGDYQLSLETQHHDTRQRLLTRKEYYNEMVDQWYWKSLNLLQTEHQHESGHISAVQRLIQSSLADIESVECDVKDARSESLVGAITSKMKQLKDTIVDLQESLDTWTELGFTLGHPDVMGTDQLGALISHRTSLPVNCSANKDSPVHSDYVVVTHDTSCSPAAPSDSNSPCGCVRSFNTRHGDSSDYMATSISMTSDGDFIITDTGTDSVQIFSATGGYKRHIHTVPDDQPTTAVQFADNLIAVACCEGVKLYDCHTGIYSSQQLSSDIQRPQGLSVNSDGDLVVSGYQLDTPAIAIFGKTNFNLKDVISGISEVLPDCELFSKPWYITTDESDNIIISDLDNHTISMVTPAGLPTATLGGLGARVGQFFTPAGLCVTRNGHVIVCDSRNNRVQIHAPDAPQTLVILDQVHDGIVCPMDVTLDSRGNLAVLQSDGIVKVFRRW